MIGRCNCALEIIPEIPVILVRAQLFSQQVRLTGKNWKLMTNFRWCSTKLHILTTGSHKLPWISWTSRIFQVLPSPITCIFHESLCHSERVHHRRVGRERDEASQVAGRADRGRVSVALGQSVSLQLVHLDGRVGKWRGMGESEWSYC